MSENDDISNTFWGRFKTSEELEDFFRPALEKLQRHKTKSGSGARDQRSGCGCG